jgi:hypothetical protein
MFVLRQLLGQAQASTNLQLHLAFIDHTEAYNNINWDALWQGRTYGVHARLISLLEDLHSRTRAIVWLGGHLGRNFLITSGV